MPNYRRAYVPGGTFFFTVVTERRAKILCGTSARACLRRAFRNCRERWPFSVVTIVLLPDHLHAVWTLPKGDSDYPTRWGWIKKEFTKAWLAEGGLEQPISASRRHHRRRGVWQRHFWEHVLQDEADLERHCDYIHYNPVKHGLVACPSDWPYSSFHRWVRLGHYPPDWGCSSSGPLKFDDLDSSAIE
jgi:putative transposase